jgi:hypothetical protein
MQRYMHTKFDAIDAQFAEVKADIAGLRDDLPGIVGGAVREAMRRDAD